ncbi:MAG: glycosyltransferase family 9 protein [Armatimonadetes bacterium]|nr:glycosyltransferase family 9 protein [Armatimonadota bacterium]
MMRDWQTAEYGAHAPDGTRRVAIFCLSALGELLLGLPLMAETRRLYPQARLLLVCERPAVAAWARELGMADEVIPLPAGARWRPLALGRSLWRMSRLQADLALQLFTSHGSFGNLLVGATKARVRCGYESGRFADLLTHRLRVREDRHHVTMNLDLLRRLGHQDVAEPSRRFLPEIEPRSERFPPGSLAQRFGRYGLISIGSDPTLAFKRWPAAKWADLCVLLAADGITPVFVGHSSEHEDAEDILTQAAVSGVNLAGQTDLSDLASLIRSSAIVVGTDGMLLHLAAAMRKPCVGIYGPTNPVNVGPWGQQALVARLPLPCAPCYGPATIGKDIGCRSRECLHHLPVQTVYQKVIGTLERTERGA